MLHVLNFALSPPLCYSLKKQTIELGKRRFLVHKAGLNTSTGCGVMPDKKSSYVRRKMFLNGLSCPAWSLFFIYVSYQRLKTQKHSVSMGLCCSVFSFHGHLNRQCTYAVSLYSKPSEMFEQKDFIPIHCCCFFCPAWDSFSSENSFESLHSAKNLIKENVNHSCLFKPEMWNNRRSVY